ncbi:hypothetical protein GZH47_00200 [Paenibacillus rhizovicinus]|uniref:Uncharacterized protein n=1 Tax=Paenibacillus rhizovicinus TaxID=2704463 RepID=A0A6C0NY50_9BACL|nr:hypothetical protein [Paenibacillus rhizovicinus]QHW29402.1 hypothetical protein GZH47_00200 [Paenibacillus rhizovicinus]
MGKKQTEKQDRKKQMKFKIREQAADILVQNLKDVGFKVAVQKYDFGTLIQKVLKGDYDLPLFNRDYYIQPSLYFSLFVSDNPSNFIFYKNPKADELIQQGETEVDSATEG